MKKQLSIIDKSRVLTLRKEGYTLAQISNKTGIALTTVHRTINSFANNPSFFRKKGSGRPSIITEEIHQCILSEIKKCPVTTSKKLCNFINERFDTSISRKTIIRALKNKDFKPRIALRKPFISTKNQK